MSRRRSIRILCLTLLLLSIGGWLLSTFFTYGVACGHDRYWIGLNRVPGGMMVSGALLSGLINPPKWVGHWEYTDPQFWFWPWLWGSQSSHTTQELHVLGFGVMRQSTGPDHHAIGITIPFWALILLSATGFWLGRRKPKLTGFPVEIKSHLPEQTFETAS